MKIEEIMSQAAYSQVTEAMPALDKYLLGFETIDADEENNRGLGVLLAKIGDNYIFIPSIYRNGRICDMDLLYEPANNRFLPVQDNTLSYLLARTPDVVGETVEKPSMSVGGHTGGAGGVSLNLPFTMFTKVASSGNIPNMLKMAGGMMAELLLKTQGSFDAIYQSLDDISAPSLGKLASAALSEDLIKKLDTVDGYNAFAQWYSESDIQRFADKLIDNVVLDRRRRDEAAQTHFDEPVKVLTSASSEARDLSDDEKAMILRDGAIIVDKRGLLPSVVYKMKQNSDWQTPAHNGLHELLTLGGKTITAYVINLNAAKGFDKFTATNERYAIIPVDDGVARDVHVIDFAPLSQYYPMDMTTPMGGVDVGSLTSDTIRGDNELVVVTRSGDSLMLSKLWGGDSNPHWLRGEEDRFIDVRLRPTELYEYDGVGRFPKDSDSGDQWVKTGIESKLSPMPQTASGKEIITQIIIGKPNSKLQIRGNSLRVPEGSKFYTIPSGEGGNDLDLVDQVNAVEAIAARDKLIGVTIYSNDGLVTLADGMTKKASGSKFDVAKVLVSDYAVEPKEAVKLVKEACAKQGGESYLIKIADQTGFNMAFSQEEPANIDYNESQTLTPRSTEKVNDKEIIDKAQQAGVRQVLDVELLKLLAEDDGSVKEVQSYIPKLLGAVDALGRLLFLTRVNESLHEAYGDQRTVLMEKSIKSAFFKVWDIILGLQQGKVDNISDLMGGDLSQTVG